MLKECLLSILSQTFTDFEVLVGNNYTQELLSSEVLGIEDPRVRFINHPQDLGQTGNMNSLLQMSRGQYFTWLADDDMYMLNFLASIHASLSEFQFPLVVFTSYVSGATCPVGIENIVSPGILLSGRQFLKKYLNRDLVLQGCYGVFNINYIREIGGIKRLGNGFGPYSDNLLAIRCGLLENVIYIDAPLLFFRTHVQSLSYSSIDVEAYRSAQEELFSISNRIFKNNSLGDDFYKNIFSLLRWCVNDMLTVIGRSGFVVNRKFVVVYFKMLHTQISSLKGSAYYDKAIKFVMLIFIKNIWLISTQTLRNKLPAWVKYPVKRVRRFLHGFQEN